MTKQLAPSIFAADFADIPAALRSYEEAGVDLIHYDVMDNHFVPNISFGPKFIEDVTRRTSIPGDAHLMIDLERGIDDYLGLDVSYITLHLEATSHYILPYLEKIKKAGKKTGISLKPYTPVEVLIPYFDALDMILIMSVEPGFSGQSFMPASLDRLRRLRDLLGGRDVALQIDGGISRANYQDALQAGADILVMGSAYFKDPDIKSLCRAIQNWQS